MHETFPIPMRSALIAAVLAGSLGGCAPPEPYYGSANLPYAACGDMATIRANLTGNPEATPQGDAILRSLGVRCVGVGRTALVERY